MFRKTLSALTLTALLGASIAPAMAFDFKGMPDMRYNPYAAHVQARGTTAGVYLRVPFRGGVKHPKKDIQLGLALGTKSSGKHHAPGHFAAVGASTIIDLSLDLSGGQPLTDKLRFYGETVKQIKASQVSKSRVKRNRRTNKARPRLSPEAAKLMAVSFLLQMTSGCRNGSTSSKCK